MSQEIITELVTEDLAMAEIKITELGSGKWDQHYLILP